MKQKKFFNVSGILYGLFLVYVLFLRSVGHDSRWTYTEYLKNMINFIPLQSIYILLTTPVISASIVVDFLKNFIGNIVLFIPWGFFIPFYFKDLRTSKQFVITTLIAILLIESVQLFTMLGMFDIEDVILNLVGAYIGFL
ncbi:MAG: VanZ family protein, partial [Ruminococcus sp.]|nr:VanZ family protein [Ruminococcus sp.]